MIRSASCSEEDKSVTLKKAEEHLRIVSMERSYYNTITKDCAESVQVHYRTSQHVMYTELSRLVNLYATNLLTVEAIVSDLKTLSLVDEN